VVAPTPAGALAGEVERVLASVAKADAPKTPRTARKRGVRR
jgi:hypothetical protein